MSITLKSFCATLLLALLALTVLSCSGGSPNSSSSSRSSSKPGEAAAETTTAVTPLAPGQLYANDGDNEPSNDEDLDDSAGHTVDEDNDPSADHMPTQNNRYHDSDDNELVHFGHAADAADMQAAVALVKRYQAAAVAGNGAAGCSLMYSVLAESAPEDYGQSQGPPYLRGATTCEAVASRLFQHFHSRLTMTMYVTGMRVMGNRGIALLGSRTLPASQFELRRERGVWKVGALMPTTLP